MNIWKIHFVLMGIILILLLAFFWNMFRERKHLKIMDLKKGFSYLFKHTGIVILCSILFLAIYCGAGYLCNKSMAALRIKFNYEEAAKGLNPNKTRFNASNLISNEILEKVIEKGDFPITVEELHNYVGLASNFDEREITANSAWNIATEYYVTCSPQLSGYGIEIEDFLEILADVYYEYFYGNYLENDSILELNFDDLEGRDYIDTKEILSVKAGKVRDYIGDYNNENPAYRLKDGGESFSSLKEKINNFIDVDLERYGSYILENGLSEEPEQYTNRMDYQNRLLQVDYKKKMAEYDVRLETIELYDEQMARIVLVPTTDETEEYYMSRTKIGADYFADEADAALKTASDIQVDIENNSYAKAQVENSQSGEEEKNNADRMLGELVEELKNLSEQSKEISDAYLAEKRNGYLNTSVKPLSLKEKMEVKQGILFTVVFTVVFGGYLAMADLRKESHKQRNRHE